MLYYAVLLLPAQILGVLQNTYDLIHYLRNSSVIGTEDHFIYSYSQMLNPFTA